MLIAGLVLALPATARAEEPIRPRYLMDREPAEQVVPGKWVLPETLLPMWKRALERPDSELRRQIAHAIAEAARRDQDVRSLIPVLRTVVAAQESHAVARHAAAATLIQLDDRESAELLIKTAAQDGKDLRLLVEPALARWNVQAIVPEWRARLSDSTTPRRELLLAITGLGTVRDPASFEVLLNRAQTAGAPADVRLAAARAAGDIRREGLEAPARDLLTRKTQRVLEHLCATALIAHHRSDEAIALHQQLGRDTEPTVAAASLRSLFAADPGLVLPLAEESLRNLDVNVRRVAVDCYVALPTPERMQTLSLRLNDRVPALRSHVRESFRRLSREPSLDATIRAASRTILDGDDWRGQEQAALLLAALDQKDCSGRLVELLESPRPEAFVAAAWALKTLAVPETAAPVLTFLKKRTNPAAITTRTDAQDAHLMELLGILKYQPARPLMVAYIPKNAPYAGDARAGAVWALGHLHEGDPDEPLSDQLMARLMDFASSPPELFQVRRAAALALGRMKAQKHLPGIKTLLGPTAENDLMELTLRQTVHQISGELVPLRPDPLFVLTGWVLEPIPVELPESAGR